MAALLAKKFNKKVIIVSRGFCLANKILLNSKILLQTENPAKYFDIAKDDVFQVNLVRI